MIYVNTENGKEEREESVSGREIKRLKFNSDTQIHNTDANLLLPEEE